MYQAPLQKRNLYRSCSPTPMSEATRLLGPLGGLVVCLIGSLQISPECVAVYNAFDGGPVQPRTIGLDQSVQMTKQLVWDLDGLVQHLDRLFGLLVETVYRV